MESGWWKVEIWADFFPNMAGVKVKRWVAMARKVSPKQNDKSFDSWGIGVFWEWSRIGTGKADGDLSGSDIEICPSETILVNLDSCRQRSLRMSRPTINESIDGIFRRRLWTCHEVPPNSGCLCSHPGMCEGNGSLAGCRSCRCSNFWRSCTSRKHRMKSRLVDRTCIASDDSTKREVKDIKNKK